MLDRRNLRPTHHGGGGDVPARRSSALGFVRRPLKRALEPTLEQIETAAESEIPRRRGVDGRASFALWHGVGVTNTDAPEDGVLTPRTHVGQMGPASTPADAGPGGGVAFELSPQPSPSAAAQMTQHSFRGKPGGLMVHLQQANTPYHCEV